MVVTILQGMLVMAVALGTGAAQPNELVLYICGDGPNRDSAIVGMILCTAAPTPDLSERAEKDNLQVREGALVVELSKDGISDEAGLQPGDMIYRIGGADIEHADNAVDRLAGIRATADTVVNFLRRGRPYRVKLRLN